MKPQWNWPRLGRDLGTALLLFLLVTTISAIPILHDLDRRITDALLRSAPPSASAPSVTIVSIDDAALYKYGRWPWSRLLLADLVRKIAFSKPRVIGLDILLSEPQSAHADSIFADSLASAPTVIVDKIGQFPDGPKWVEPLPQFARNAAAVGHAQAVLDSDGICRRFPARQMTIEGARFPFAIEVAKLTKESAAGAFLGHYGIAAADDSSPISTAAPLLIPIAFHRDAFQVISAAEILDGTSRKELRGQTVLVGFGPAELGDRISTPLSQNAPSPGVEVHAQIVDAILNGRYLREFSSRTTVLMLFVVCVVAVVSYRWFRGWRGFGILLLEAITTFGGGALLFWSQQYVFPHGRFLLAFLMAPVLSSTFDIVSVERTINRQLKQLQGWLVAHRPENPRGSSELQGRLEFLQELQAELGSLYELHRSLLGATQDLVAVFDSAGKLMLSNDAFRRAWPGHGDWPTTLEDARGRLEESIEVPIVAHGALIEGEASVGEVLYFVRIVPLPPTSISPHGGAILNMTNLRARVERDRSRAESVGFVTHELRTPLVSIQGFAELMLRYPDSPACSRAPETIFRESKRLLALVNSYLDVLRLDAGAHSIRSASWLVRDIVSDVFAVLEPIAAASGNALLFTGNQNTMIDGDRPLLTGLVLNLVSNALKYGYPNTEVLVSAEFDGMDTILHVKNQGPVIPETELKSIFEPYVRGEGTAHRQTGWGLGLSFVKRIVEKHGGAISVGSNGSAGTVFTVLLPSRTVAAAAKEA